MSARPAAPRIASMSAWVTTSPSEWPERPLPGSSTPPSTSVSSSEKACASTPMPTLSSLITEQSLHEREIGRGRDLHQTRIALDDAHPPARPLDETGAVARVASTQERVAKRRDREGLRGLDREEPSAVDGLGDPAMGIDPLDGVGKRQPRDNAVPILTEPAQDPGNDLLWQQRPRRVVDERDERVVRDLRQARAHRVCACGSAGHGRVDLARAELLREQNRRLLPLFGDDDDDRIDPLGGLQALEALGQEHAPAETHERFRPVAAEPLTASGRDEDRPGAHFERATSCPFRSSKSSGLSGLSPVVNSWRTFSLITGA